MGGTKRDYETAAAVPGKQAAHIGAQPLPVTEAWVAAVLLAVLVFGVPAVIALVIGGVDLVLVIVKPLAILAVLAACVPFANVIELVFRRMAVQRRLLTPSEIPTDLIDVTPNTKPAPTKEIQLVSTANRLPGQVPLPPAALPREQPYLVTATLTDAPEYPDGVVRLCQSDVEWLLNRLDYEQQAGWTVRELVGRNLPSGQEIRQDVEYRAWIGELERLGELTGRKERGKGKLQRDAAAIRADWGL